MADYPQFEIGVCLIDINIVVIILKRIIKYEQKS